MPESIIPPHGGYRKLITWRLGNLIYDATSAFCERWLNKRDRTYDQMIQAARSGVANIIEGSEASATSKKTELTLTNVAKASQEELLSDYLAFLRQRNLPIWSTESDNVKFIRKSRPGNMQELRMLMKELLANPSFPKGRPSILQEIAGNTMITLIHQETYLLKRQIARLAFNFKEDGGFTERLYRIRKERREEYP